MKKEVMSIRVRFSVRFLRPTFQLFGFDRNEKDDISSSKIQSEKEKKEFSEGFGDKQMKLCQFIYGKIFRLEL